MIGVLVSPRATFEHVVASPRWLGVLVVSLAVIAAVTATLIATDVGQRALLEQQLEAFQTFGGTITDEQRAQMSEMAGLTPYFAAAQAFVGIPIICVVVAGLLFVLAYGFLGARVEFTQVFAVVVHAGVVFVAQACFVSPLNYVRESMSNPATLAAFAPMLESDSFVYRFLNAVDLFFLWWIMVLSVGFAVLTGRRTAPIATTLYFLYGGIAIIIAAVLTRLAG